MGLQLGLSPDELATIKANSVDVEECLRRVLTKWFDRTVQPTWQEVAAALKSPGLEDHRLAMELEKKCKVSKGWGSCCPQTFFLVVGEK